MVDTLLLSLFFFKKNRSNLFERLICRVFWETVDSARVPSTIVTDRSLLSQSGFDGRSVKAEHHSAVHI